MTYRAVISEQLAASLEERRQIRVVSVDVRVLNERRGEDAVKVVTSESGEVHRKVAFDENRNPIREDVERDTGAGTIAHTPGGGGSHGKVVHGADVCAGGYAVPLKIALDGSGASPRGVGNDGRGLGYLHLGAVAVKGGADEGEGVELARSGIED